MSVSNEASRSPMRHVSHQFVSNQVWWSPIRHVGLQSGMSVYDQACRSPIRHVGLQLVSNETCWSRMGLRSGMLVFNLQWVSDQACWSPRRHVGLLRVSEIMYNFQTEVNFDNTIQILIIPIYPLLILTLPPFKYTLILSSEEQRFWKQSFS